MSTTPKSHIPKHKKQIENYRRVVIFFFSILLSVFSIFNGRRGTILPFSVEIFTRTRVRARELVDHNFHWIKPTQLCAGFTFTTPIRFGRNFEMKTQTWYVPGRCRAMEILLKSTARNQQNLIFIFDLLKVERDFAQSSVIGPHKLHQFNWIAINHGNFDQ